MFDCTIPAINSPNNLAICAPNGNASEVGFIAIAVGLFFLGLIFQAAKELFEVLGRQQDKCPDPCEKTIVYFGFPFFQDGKAGKLKSGVNSSKKVLFVVVRELCRHLNRS